MITYIVTVKFTKGAITEMTRRFYNKKQAEACAKKYRDAIYDPDNEIAGVYLDEKLEPDYNEPEENYYEDVAA